MKRVLIITYYWPPSGGSGVQRWLKMSKYLNLAGSPLFILQKTQNIPLKTLRWKTTFVPKQKSSDDPL